MGEGAQDFFFLTDLFLEDLSIRWWPGNDSIEHDQDSKGKPEEEGDDGEEINLETYLHDHFDDVLFMMRMMMMMMIT